MKKRLCALLAVLLLLSLTACRKKPVESTENTQSTQQTPTENNTSISFGTVGVNLQTTADKTAFTQPIVCPYGEGTVTVNAPRFTGIPMTAVYYSQNHRFSTGNAVVKVATQTGGRDLLITKQGRIVGEYTPVMKEDQSVKPADIGADYFAGEARYIYTDGTLCGIKDATGKVIVKPQYAQSHINFYDSYAVAEKPDGTYVVLDTAGKEYGTVPGGCSNGSGTILMQTGEPGAYEQQLYDIHGNCISDGYDSISYFYNGLALIVKDQKIGIIDNKGTVVLEPTIAFDTVTYSPDDRGFSVVFMEGDAFLLPIGGELAVITIERQSGKERLNLATLAFERFLMGKVTVSMDDGSKLYIKDFGENASYACADVSGDGIPELLVKDGTGHTNILAYTDQGIVCWYTSVSWMPLDVLENGAVLDTHSGIGTFFTYITFDQQGKKTEIHFSCPPAGKDNYAFDGKTVTQTQWEELTKPYLSPKKTELNWEPWVWPVQ